MRPGRFRKRLKRQAEELCYQENLCVLHALSFDPEVGALLSSIDERTEDLLARGPRTERFASKDVVLAFIRGK